MYAIFSRVFCDQFIQVNMELLEQRESDSNEYVKREMNKHQNFTTSGIFAKNKRNLTDNLVFLTIISNVNPHEESVCKLAYFLHYIILCLPTLKTATSLRQN